jgi:hypothetical protein
MGKINKNTALFVTGTIVPNSTYVAHNDINSRRKEYLDNLRFYVSVFPKGSIYFLENSAYDLARDEEFQELFKNNSITLLKYPVSDKYNLGKGYQEFQMLDQAIEQLAGHYTSFIKVTGRYRVTNILKLTGVTKAEFIVDCHKKPKVAQTNVFYVTAEFYKKYLKGLYQNADDSKHHFIEKVIYDALADKKLLGKISPFRVNPIVRGISGSYGGTLNRNKYKMMARNFERRIMSLLGIKQFLIEY